MNQRRIELIKKTAYNRQGNLTVVLENIVDPHNVVAVIRSCDAVGIHEIYLLFTENSINQKEFTIGKRASAGSRKWVDINVFNDIEICFKAVKERYEKVYSTYLGENSVSLFDLNMTDSVALMFGNERDGLSEKALEYSDGNFTIPMMGMSQSLNISVACAVTLYEAQRQRLEKNMFSKNHPWPEENREALFQNYLGRNNQEYRDGRTHTYQIDIEQ